MAHFSSFFVIFSSFFVIFRRFLSFFIIFSQVYSCGDFTLSSAPFSGLGGGCQMGPALFAAAEGTGWVAVAVAVFGVVER
jgi:hypothetical protein